MGRWPVFRWLRHTHTTPTPTPRPARALRGCAEANEMLVHTRIEPVSRSCQFEWIAMQMHDCQDDGPPLGAVRYRVRRVRVQRRVHGGVCRRPPQQRDHHRGGRQGSRVRARRARHAAPRHATPVVAVLVAWAAATWAHGAWPATNDQNAPRRPGVWTCQVHDRDGRQVAPRPATQVTIAINVTHQHPPRIGRASRPRKVLGSLASPHARPFLPPSPRPSVGRRWVRRGERTRLAPHPVQFTPNKQTDQNGPAHPARCSMVWRYLPTRRGFDYYYGIPFSCDMGT